MRIVQSLLPLVTLVFIACSAAPVTPAQPREYLSLVAARDAPEIVSRELLASILEARLLSDELNVRELDRLLLHARSAPWPGPGMQHKLENSASGVPTSGFNPVPQNSYYTTANNVYTGTEVNNHAQHMVNSIPGADPWNRKKNVKTYPKPSTGFRNTEAANPAPNSSGQVSYHAPINPPGRSGRQRANTMPTPGRSAMVGTDRVFGHRDPTDPNLQIGVSYHDPKKPVPSTSKNHPFSVAPQKQGGSVKVAGAKGWQAAKKVGNAMAFWKPKGKRANSI